MSKGIVVGIVVDNVDPNGMHRVKVEFPVDHSDRPKSSWCRMITPMAGNKRGLVMLPEVGTEVVLGFAYRSMSPYVLGAVYNGADDTPGPYANEDGDNNHRRFWSRNSHWVDFDDTDGDEHVRIKSTSEDEAITIDMNAAEKTIDEAVVEDAIHEASETFSFKCKDFKLDASGSIDMSAGTSAVLQAGTSASIDSSGNQDYSAGKVDINGGSPGSTSSASSLPGHNHPPVS